MQTDLEKSRVALSAVLPEEKRKIWLMRGGFIIGGVGALAVSTPFIWGAASSLLGFGAIGVLAIFYIGVVRSLPLVAQKFENRLLRARKEEARANPVEQLQNRYVERSQKLEESKVALSLIGSNLTSMGRQLEERTRQDPDHDLSTAKKQYDAMVTFYQANIERLKEAQKKLKEFKKAIERKDFEYKFALTGRAALSSLKQAQSDDPTQQLLSDEAVRSIETQFDEVFATMELDAILEQASRIKASSTTENAVDAEFTITN